MCPPSCMCAYVPCRAAGHFHHLAPSQITSLNFIALKPLFMNLAQSQAHCSPANEIKATFAFLPAFNYISGRTARAPRLNEERGDVREKTGPIAALWTTAN